MRSLLPLLFALATAAAVRPTDYSADMVVLQGARAVQTMKLYVSGPKSRVEGLSAGPLGRIVTIARKDRGVTWTLYPDRRQYTEQPLAAGGRPGSPDLANFDIASLKHENLGRETILGRPCTKLRVALGNLPNGQPMVATAWVADGLDLPLRLETMGMTQENRNLRIAPQPPGLFEIPEGFSPAGTPGKPAGLTAPPAVTRAPGVATAAAGAWRPNTNLPGGDYRSVDMATSDPARCQTLCGREAQCKAWTLVKPEQPGGMGYCWLKNIVPQASPEECCISGVKGAWAGAARAAAAARPAAAGAWKANTNLPGGDYRSVDMATSDPARCQAVCDREAQCRAWTLVKPEQQGGMGYCWLKDSVPPETREDCCVSGVKGASSVPAPRASPAWKANTNLPGGDYRSVDMATSDPARCQAVCDKEARCRAWTLVKPEQPGGMGYCWLKDSVPPETREDCCVSGVKR